MTTASQSIHTGNDSSRWRRAMIVVVCALVAAIDGYDIGSISLVMPLIGRDLGLEVRQYGPIFSASLAGMALGALLGGWLGDRFGRRVSLLTTLGFIGLSSLLTTLSQTAIELMALRFLTGLGLGGAMPSVIALTAEYASPKYRATLVTLMLSGLSVGMIVCGLTTPALTGAFGWRMVFFVGGVIPILLAVPAARYIRAASRRLETLGATTEFPALGTTDESPQLRSISATLTSLLRDGRTPGTLFIWLAFFSNLFLIYFLLSWLPALFVRNGFSLNSAITVSVVFTTGGLVGGIGVSLLYDRFGAFRILPPAYFTAALLLVIAGYVTHSVTLLYLVVFVTGITIFGPQYCLNSVAATFYPQAVRGTGLGWALGVGRLGAFLSPVVAGFLVVANWSLPAIFSICAICAILCGSVMVLLRRFARDEISYSDRS